MNSKLSKTVPKNMIGSAITKGLQTLSKHIAVSSPWFLLLGSNDRAKVMLPTGRSLYLLGSGALQFSTTMRRQTVLKTLLPTCLLQQQHTTSTTTNGSVRGMPTEFQSPTNPSLQRQSILLEALFIQTDSLQPILAARTLIGLQALQPLWVATLLVNWCRLVTIFPSIWISTGRPRPWPGRGVCSSNQLGANRNIWTPPSGVNIWKRLGQTFVSKIRYKLFCTVYRWNLPMAVFSRNGTSTFR